MKRHRTDTCGLQANAPLSPPIGIHGGIGAMREHEMEGLRGRADALRAEGYVLDIRLEGYVVRRNDRFVGSAAIDGRYNGRSAAMKMDARIEHLKSAVILGEGHQARLDHRSEEHTSELQSLMRISYAVFCLKKNTLKNTGK